MDVQGCLQPRQELLSTSLSREPCLWPTERRAERRGIGRCGHLDGRPAGLGSTAAPAGPGDRLPVLLGPGRDRERAGDGRHSGFRSEEHTSELLSRENLVCRLLLEKKKQ